MKRQMAVWCAVGLAVCAVMTASAAKLDVGTQELYISGMAQNLDVLQYSVNAGYGYYVAAGLKVGGAFGYEAEDKDSSLLLGADAEYNMVGDSAMVPFVGVGIRWMNSMPEEGDTESSYVILPNAGVKYFVTDALSVGARLQYYKADAERYKYEDEFKDNKVTVELDTRFYF